MTESDRGHPEDRAQEIFEKISELPPEAQERRLEEMCDDEEVRLEVERMLEAYGRLQEMMAVMDEGDHSEISEKEPAEGIEQVDRFELLERAGEGGMGVVYRARDTQLDRVVALKLLPDRFGDDQTARQRFLREAQTASQLDHPNVAPLHEYGETDDGRTYLVMPFYDGDTLEGRLSAGPLDLNDALDVATQLCEGLAAAHKEGIVHRDVKPGNVLLPDGQPVKLVDFGLAKWTDETAITRTDSVLGSVAYMSPEQLQGQALDERTDVWSLGVVLYEMLTGERPFEGRYPEALAYEIINGEHEPPSSVADDLPAGVDDIISRCLSKNPDDRFESTEVLLQAISRIQSGRIINTESPSLTDSVPFSRSGGIGFSPSILGALTALLIGLGSWAMSNEHTVEILPHLSGVSQSQRIGVIAPAESLGGTDREVIRDLTVTLTSLLSQIQPILPRVSGIIPASDMNRVKSVSEAENQLGAQKVITVHVLQSSKRPRLRFNLVETSPRRTISSKVVEIDSASRSLRSASLAPSIANLFGATIPDTMTTRLYAGAKTNAYAVHFFERARERLDHDRNLENLASAERFFRLALQEDTTFRPALAGLAQVYWQRYALSGDSSAAGRARNFESQVKQLETSAHPDLYVQRGILHALRGSNRAAADDFAFAVSLDPDNVEALRGLGRARAELGQHQRAESAFRRAIDTNPSSWKAHHSLGLYLMDRNRYQNASRQFRKVIELDSTSATGQINLATSLYFQEDFQRAKKLYRDALESPVITPTEQYKKHSNLKTINYYQGNYNRAASRYETALNIDSSDYRVWGNLMHTYERLGDEKRKDWAARNAKVRARRKLKINPTDAQLLTMLAGYEAALEDSTEADQLLQKALQQRPFKSSTFYRVGTVYETIGRRDAAIQFILEALDRGYSRTEVTTDPELADLREDPRYQRKVDQFARTHEYKTSPVE